MRIHGFYLQGLVLLTLLTSCDTGKNGSAGFRSTGITGTGIVSYSESYRPPEFSDSDRLQKITGALSGISQVCSDFAEQNHLPGLIYGIVVDDSLVFAGSTGVINTSGRQPVTVKSLFRIASMTKSFTAMAILKLRDEGKLSLADPACRYIPELKGLTYLTKDASPVTIHNLLSMTAGFPEDNPWGDRKLDISEDEFMSMLGSGISFSSVPSSRYEYSNLGYAILGNIITRVSGQSYQDYITGTILEPLGMNSTVWEYSEIPADLLAQGYSWEDGEWKPEPMLHDGAFAPMAGLITSGEDFSRYISFLLSSWPPRSDPETGPVKRSTLREMQRQGEPALYPEAKDLYGAPCPFTYGYGYGLGIARWCNDELWVMHGGGLPGFGSHFIYLPDYGIGIFSFANLTYAPAAQLNYEIKKILFTQSIPKRQLPCPDILAERGEQVIRLINTWDTILEAEILADNFYLDRNRDEWIKYSWKVLRAAGEISSIDPVIPENQLRGRFMMHGERARVEVFFTLTPENIPKIQELTLRLFKLESS
jgi:CubicO group peptidase (beta-lactamase class C family)